MTPTRRDFLRTSAGAGAALLAGSAALAAPSSRATADAVIFLMLTGGPSQHDTWDPKPDAPSDVRGPFAPIRTRVPGLHVSELFPRMAGIADQFSLVRSVHHADEAVHAVGFQWVNTGHLFRDGPEWPGTGAVTLKVMGARRPGVPANCAPPVGQIDTGVEVSHGQGHGFLPPSFAPRSLEHTPAECGAGSADWLAESHGYGFTSVSFRFWQARTLVEGGVRHVTVNMYPSVFNRSTWDCHAATGTALACDLNEVRDTVAPSFDAAFTQLVADLHDRGLLERTLVVATGEFGRTPRINGSGGRDHWPGVWTTIIAGGGVKGGRVVGSSDAFGGEPKDRPVHARDIPATIFHALGIAPHATISGPDGLPVRVYNGRPITELF